MLIKPEEGQERTAVGLFLPKTALEGIHVYPVEDLDLIDRAITEATQRWTPPAQSPRGCSRR